MPYTSPTLGLSKWKTLCANNKWLQQFGQSDDGLTNNGASGCTDTILQTLILGIKKKRVTHNQIRRVCGRGYSSADRGLTAGNVKTVIDYYNLPYKLVFGLSWAEVRKYQARGPIMLAVRYADYPNWKNYKGVRRPLPYAAPEYHAGRNQFSGFYGAHMTLSLGSAKHISSTGRYMHNDYWVKEPNHGSPARPERPPYDRVQGAWIADAYQSYGSKLNRVLYAVVPTKNIYL